VFLPLVSLSLYINHLAVSKHTDSSFTFESMAVFQTIYAFLVSGIITLSWKAVGGIARYPQNLKLTLLLLGMLYVFTSFLFILIIEGEIIGSKYLAFFPAIAIIVWTFRAWTAYGYLNDSSSRLKYWLSFILVNIFSSVLAIALEHITPYFIKST